MTNSANFGDVTAYASSVLEFLVNVAVLPVAALNLYAIIATSVIHINLKLLLLTQSLAILLYAVSELVRLAYSWAVADLKARPPLMSVMLFWYGGIALNSMVGYMLAVERVFAAVRSDSYEKGESRWFGWVCMAIVLAVAAMICATEVLAKDPSVPGAEKDIDSSSIVMFYVVGGLSLVSFLVLKLLYHYSLAKYAQPNEANGEHSLRRRYQASENVRTTRQLVPVLFLHFVSTVEIGAGTMAHYYNWVTDMETLNWIGTFVSLFNTVLYLLIQLVVIKHHPILMKRIRALLPLNWRRCNGVADAEAAGGGANAASQTHHLRDINGSRLIPAHNDEGDIHFRMLSAYWG